MRAINTHPCGSITPVLPTGAEVVFPSLKTSKIAIAKTTGPITIPRRPNTCKPPRTAKIDQFAEADTISDKLRPEEVVHPADHCGSPHRKNNCLGPVPDYEQVGRSGNPDSRRADQRQDARQNGHHSPERGRRNPKNPEHDAAQRTLDQGDPKP